MKTKTEKYLAAGAVVAAGVAAMIVCPVSIAPMIKIATFVGARNVLR